MPLPVTPQVSHQSLGEWLGATAPAPYDSALSTEATDAHNAHLAYCEALLTRILETCRQQVRLYYTHADS